MERIYLCFAFEGLPLSLTGDEDLRTGSMVVNSNTLLVCDIILKTNFNIVFNID